MADEIRDMSGGNFTIVHNELIDSELLPPHEKVVYITLKRYANSHTGKAFPGMKRIARTTGMSDRKVRSCVRRLEELGLIKCELRDNNTNLYTILPLKSGLSTSERHSGGAECGSGGGRNVVPHPPEHGSAKQDLINKTNKEQERAAVFQRLYDLYLSKDIVRHSKPTDGMKRAVNARLKDFTEDELTQAINNYAVVLKGPEYYFKYKYTFSDLMREKDILRFVDGADPLNNLRKNDYQTSNGQAPPKYERYIPDYSAGEN